MTEPILTMRKDLAAVVGDAAVDLVRRELADFPAATAAVIQERVADLLAGDVQSGSARRVRGANTVASLVHSRALPDGAALVFVPASVNRETRQQIDGWLAQDPRRGKAAWSNHPTTPLRWAVDGRLYSPSRLALAIMQQAGRAPQSVRGPQCWFVQSSEPGSAHAGLSLVEIAERLSPSDQRNPEPD